MKYSSFFLLLIFHFSIHPLQAQLSRSAVFEKEKMIFFGIDFSEARFIGSHGFTDPYDIKDRYFRKWNRLLFMEKEKYDLKKYHRKNEVSYDFSIVDRRNEQVDEQEMVIDKSYALEKELLPKIIKDYDSKDHPEGLGMVYIVESFDKTEDYAYVWITFFDLSTKKILMARRMRGKTGGFGLRNYWARTFYNIMQQTKRLWNSWKYQ